VIHTTWFSFFSFINSRVFSLLKNFEANIKESYYNYYDIITCILVDGSWGFWGPWSECTKMCDNGTTTRKKQCNAPEPQNGGLECEGRDYATTSCNVWACPGNYFIPSPIGSILHVSDDEVSYRWNILWYVFLYVANALLFQTQMLHVIAIL
jgi:hypothetical protein